MKDNIKERVVIGIGEVLWDILPDGTKMLGGAPANFAYHVMRQGISAVVVSAVGDDSNGKELCRSLQAKQLPTAIEVVEFPTGAVNVELDDCGIPQYDIIENVAWDNIPATESVLVLARSASAVCFGSLAQRFEVSKATIRTIVQSVPDDALRVFDVNLRQHYYSSETLEWSMSHCDVLKLNDEELQCFVQLFDLNGDETDCCRQLISRYEISQVVLTKGAEGSLVVTSKTSNFVPAVSVEVVDTIGAGDAFTATYIASILKGKSIVEAQYAASVEAAHVCSHAGAMP